METIPLYIGTGTPRPKVTGSPTLTRKMSERFLNLVLRASHDSDSFGRKLALGRIGNIPAPGNSGDEGVPGEVLLTQRLEAVGERNELSRSRSLALRLFTKKLSPIPIMDGDVAICLDCDHRSWPNRGRRRRGDPQDDGGGRLGRLYCSWPYSWRNLQMPAMLFTLDSSFLASTRSGKDTSPLHLSSPLRQL